VSIFIGRQAIVIGAGMSGLGAARALADHFEQVTVLERDTFPADPVPRPGVPQSWHLHGLLGGGLRAFSELFPDFETDLIGADGVPVRAGLDFLFEIPGYDPFPRRDLGWVTYAMSRPLIEQVVRRRVERHANITLRQGCRALEIAAGPDGASASGIRYETKEGRQETLAAALIVDASARGTLTLAFLKSLGRPMPEQTRIEVNEGIASALFAVPDNFSSDWKGVFTIPAARESSRGGIMVRVEENRWMVTLFGRHGEWPPGEGKKFLGYAQSLRTSTIYSAIKDAKPLRDVVRFGFTENLLRHFGRLDLFPRGLLPIGDALCRFNPMYGQGMSVAAMEAALLRRILSALAAEQDPLGKLAPAFFAEAQVLIETPWAISAVPDFIYPETKGDRPADLESALRFEGAVARIAARDPAVHKLMVEVQHLLKPRSVYREPALVERVKAEMAEAW
jgi:2-polyprenyl-6-methoxyphenol hydroxylase-like FAD-dependent oxidoreductase